jgi:hypothetical protein
MNTSIKRPLNNHVHKSVLVVIGDFVDFVIYRATVKFHIKFNKQQTSTDLMHCSSTGITKQHL